MKFFFLNVNQKQGIKGFKKVLYNKQAKNLNLREIC